MNGFFAHCSKSFFTQKNRAEKTTVSLLIHFTSEANGFFAAFSKYFFKAAMTKYLLSLPLIGFTSDVNVVFAHLSKNSSLN